MQRVCVLYWYIRGLRAVYASDEVSRELVGLLT